MKAKKRLLPSNAVVVSNKAKRRCVNLTVAVKTIAWMLSKDVSASQDSNVELRSAFAINMEGIAIQIDVITAAYRLRHAQIFK